VSLSRPLISLIYFIFIFILFGFRHFHPKLDVWIRLRPSSSVDGFGICPLT
jgi:hypothetical protein